MVAVGLGLGLGGALAIRNAGREARPEPTPSVKEFSFASPPAFDPATAVTAPEPPAAPTEEPVDGPGAVSAFLRSLADARPEKAYPLLDTASRERFPSVAAWTAAQADRINPLTFEIGQSTPAGGGIDVAVDATHRPSLDPFRGLVPGRSQSQWRAAQEPGGIWRVASDPISFRPLLPSDSTAPEVVSAWVSRLAACDPAGAATYQVDTHLYGPPSLVGAPCDKGGAWTAGQPAGLDRTPDPRAFLAAFGPEVGSWARLVPVQGPGGQFLAAVAPMGDTWQVLGVAVQ